MSDAKVTSVKQWKGKKRRDEQTPLKLPSGNTCLVRPVDPQDFLTSGAIPNSLLPFVQEAMKKAQGRDEAEAPDDDLALELMANPERIMEAMQLFDTIVLAAVIEPPVQPAPPEGAERDEDLLYVDEVDLDDKVFIAQFAMGGTGDLETFRDRSAAAVAPGGDGGAVEGTAKPSARRKR